MTQLMFRIDELEGNKTKLQMRLQEAEETIDSLHTKVTLRYGHVESMLFVQVASTEKTTSSLCCKRPPSIPGTKMEKKR